MKQRISIGTAFILCTALTSCDAGFVVDVGRRSIASSSTSVESLLSSSALIAAVDKTSAHASGTPIDYLVNRGSLVDFEFKLVPDANVAASLNDDWISIVPSAGGAYVSSALNDSVYLQYPTIVAVVDRSSRGDVMSINPSDRNASAFQLKIGASEVRASYVSSSTDQTSVSIDPSSMSGSSMIVAASFGSAASSLLLSVNGRVATSFSTTGVPSTPATSYQAIQLGSSTSGETFKFKRLFTFSRALTPRELGLMIEHVARLENMTVTLDPELQAPDETGPADPLYASAQAVLQQKCSSCHSTWVGLSGAQLQTLGLVIPGDAASSKLYYRMTGSAGGLGPKTMPTSGSVSPSDVEAIEAWIENLTP